MPVPPLGSGSAHLRSGVQSVRRRTHITTHIITTATTTQPPPIPIRHQQPRITTRPGAAGTRITAAITPVRTLFKSTVNANGKVGYVSRDSAFPRLCEGHTPEPCAPRTRGQANDALGAPVAREWNAPPPADGVFGRALTV